MSQLLPNLGMDVLPQEKWMGEVVLFDLTTYFAMLDTTNKNPLAVCKSLDHRLGEQERITPQDRIVRAMMASVRPSP